MAKSKIRHHRYIPPDPAFVDGIYSFDDGGLTPVRDRDYGWVHGCGQKVNCLVRYRRGKAMRSCYQGFWWCHQNGASNALA
jgi:hypothetical protein